MARRRLRRPMLILLGLLVAYLTGCWTAASGYVRPTRVAVALPAGFSEVRIDGNPAWTVGPTETVVVLAHGYGGDRSTWTGLMDDLRRAGIGTIAPAMPGQEASAVDGVGFGKKEAAVVAACGRWARARGAKRVVAMGLSMGGAAAWLASAEAPGTFDGVVSDAAFPTFKEAMDRFLDRVVPGGSFWLRPVVWFARAMSGVDPDAIRPIDAARAWSGRPALVIQGDADRLFPIAYGERLAEAAVCPLWRVPGAGHAETYAVDPKGYAERVVALVRSL